MASKQYTLFYIHDPMCSWCWGFHNVWQDVKKNLLDLVNIEYIVGGLAADSDEPMPLAQQAAIAGYWRTIQSKIPGTQFNFDFWEKCSPRRSTYPACRAVLAVKLLDNAKESDMIVAIQHAYYLNAENPSNIDTLISCAQRIGFSANEFEQMLNSEATKTLFQEQLNQAHNLGASGFPSLVLASPSDKQAIMINYTNSGIIIQKIKDAIHI